VCFLTVTAMLSDCDQDNSIYGLQNIRQNRFTSLELFSIHRTKIARYNFNDSKRVALIE